jgi:hypothetical protein
MEKRIISFDGEKVEWEIPQCKCADKGDKAYDDARKYWKVLKMRLKDEGSELVSFCYQLKMVSHNDGKMYSTDVLDTKGILRLVQSIPSKKAEPFKLWLAQVGNERLNEMIDPEMGFHRLYGTYKRKGYTDEWINNRIKSIDTREAYESELKRAGVDTPLEYALITNEMLKTWSGMTTREYKDFKNLKKENLKDNMSRLELALNTLAEETATQISQTQSPKGFEESKSIAKQGGNVASAARKQYEIETGKSAVTPLNFKQVKQLQGSKKTVKS